MMIRDLSLQEMKQIHKTYMKRDFPANELRPFRSIQALHAQSRYRGLGIFDGRDELLGYGFFASLRREDGVHYLFDYLAIVPERRDTGIGTEFLLRLPREMPDAASILGEVENPNLESDPAEQTVKQRRLQFYLRSGVQDTGVLSRLFGVDYRVMEFPVRGRHSPEEIQELYRDFYRSFLPKAVFDRMVRVEIAP
ncbi:MAG: hypothetical protein IJ206_04735 [Oscillospiraceae bacterium]|nr:hypothetical protein [Oscillospiraceae bacterium]